MIFRAIASLCVAASTLVAADLHEIRLLRPVKVGDRFDVSAKVAYEDIIKTSFDGREVEKEETVVACRLTGGLTVVAVTTKGLPKALRMKLKTVDCVHGGQQAVFFKEGDEISIRSDSPENETQVNGEAADDLQAQVIESVLSVQADDEVSDDDIFGTKEKVGVGAEWPVNAKAAVASLERNGVTGLKAKDVSGSATLVKLSEYENQPAMSLRMSATINGKNVTLSNLPENVKGEKFHSEYAVQMEVPMDPASTAGRMKGMARMEVDAAGTEELEGKKVDVAVRIERRVASDIAATPVK